METLEGGYTQGRRLHPDLVHTGSHFSTACTLKMNFSKTAVCTTLDLESPLLEAADQQ